MKNVFIYTLGFIFIISFLAFIAGALIKPHDKELGTTVALTGFLVFITIWIIARVFKIFK